MMVIEKVKEKGIKLFNYFRDEQEKKGHIGCRCSECEIDMIFAYSKLAQEEEK